MTENKAHHKFDTKPIGFNLKSLTWPESNLKDVGDGTRSDGKGERAREKAREREREREQGRRNK